MTVVHLRLYLWNDLFDISMKRVGSGDSDNVQAKANVRRSPCSSTGCSPVLHSGLQCQVHIRRYWHITKTSAILILLHQSSLSQQGAPPVAPTGPTWDSVKTHGHCFLVSRIAASIIISRKLSSLPFRFCC